MLSLATLSQPGFMVPWCPNLDRSVTVLSPPDAGELRPGLDLRTASEVAGTRGIDLPWIERGEADATPAILRTKGLLLGDAWL